jgi:catechol 2,3-dioxygenase-like lactoylglutathione lyase family enzyme
LNARCERDADAPLGARRGGGTGCEYAPRVLCEGDTNPGAVGNVGDAQAQYCGEMRGRSNSHWWGTALEAPDPQALASFYSKLLDWPVVHVEPDTTVVKPPQPGVFMVFHRADEYVPPVWPPAPGNQRPMMHLDIEVEDLEISTADALALGATLSDFQPRDNVRVLFDPAGHPFCLCLDEGG